MICDDQAVKNQLAYRMEAYPSEDDSRHYEKILKINLVKEIPRVRNRSSDTDANAKREHR